VLRVHRWEGVRRSVSEITLDAVVVTDDTGKLLDVNEASCLMFRAPKTQLIGRRLVSVELGARHALDEDAEEAGSS